METKEKRVRFTDRFELDGIIKGLNVGVERVFARVNLVLRCQTCGNEWSIEEVKNGWLPVGWWKCPGGCNNMAMERAQTKPKFK